MPEEGINKGMELTYLMKILSCAGGAAVTAVTFIHPIDMIKTRL